MRKPTAFIINRKASGLKKKKEFRGSIGIFRKEFWQIK